MNRFQKMRKVCKGYLERIPPLLIQSFQWGADWLREKILDLGEYLKRNSLRILALNTPYVIIFYLVDKEAWLYQYCQGDSSVERLMVLLLNFQMAFTSVLPSIEKMPLLAGFTGALAVKLLVMPLIIEDWLLGVFIMLEDEIPFGFSIVSIFACDMFNHCHGNHLPFSSLHISSHKYPGEIF